MEEPGHARAAFRSEPASSRHGDADTSGRRAVIVTGHFAEQKRRAGVSWVVDEMRRDGWHVTVATVGYSWISRLRRDQRLRRLDRPPEIGVRHPDPSLTTIFGYSPIHPFSLRSAPADRLLRPLNVLFRRYWERRLRPFVETADFALLECGPPLLLTGAIRGWAPDLPMAYRVSDDLRLLNAPAWLIEAEKATASVFDRISVASPILARRFAGHPGLAIDPIGVPVERLSLPFPDPIVPPRWAREIVCAGTTQLDMRATLSLAGIRPDWRIHVIGLVAGAPLTIPPNVVFHGELPYDVTAAYVRHADVGLAPYRDRAGVEYQTAQSTRMAMYRFFGLPILGPRRLCDPAVPNLVGYDPADPKSIAGAAERVHAMSRGPCDPTLEDWSALYRRIVSTSRAPGRRDPGGAAPRPS